MNKPIVWTLAGSDSSGGAGIQADLHTFQALGAYGCSIITALTAQNSFSVSRIEHTSAAMLQAQITALENDLPARAIKLGMLGSLESMQVLLTFLQRFSGKIICDPVMISSSGANLIDHDVKNFLQQHLTPRVDLLTPNIHEAEALTGISIHSNQDMELAAHKLLAMGAKSVLLKGGHSDSDYSQDYWSNGTEHAWLTIEKRMHTHTHGSGCTLSAAITACLALDYELLDAIVIAKAYVSQGIRLARSYGKGPGPVAQLSWPQKQIDLPWLTQSANDGIERPNFPRIRDGHLGFYPIIDRASWIEMLAKQGINTIQLRIKDLQGAQLENEIARAIEIGKQYNVRLFINDYWQLAIKHHAYGIHLGQEDLITADFKAIANANITLGISTHNYSELARAHALRPSYIALGTVYETTSKVMKFAPQGLERLQHWCNLLEEYPVVAIGGITLEKLPDVLARGPDGVAVISAVTKATDPKKAAHQGHEICSDFFKTNNKVKII